jgi:hypothetical protein
MSTKNKKNFIVSFILDRSGSMESCKSAVISGFKEYINGLKKSKDAVNTRFSLTTFDSESIDHLYTNTPIKEVEPLSNKTFIPRAGTPLYDAVVNTVESLAKEVTEKQPVLVVIMTDGEENSSHEHDADCFRDLVKKLKKQGNWTFTFMGANQDSWANAQKWGFDQGNTMDFASSDAGTRSAFKGLAAASVNFMAMANDTNVLRASNFFDSSKGGEKDVH